METKRLSANGLFQVRKKHTRKMFAQYCEEHNNSKKAPIPPDSEERFWKAKNKIDADVYTDCCNLLAINPEENQDRTPLELNICQIKLQERLNLEGYKSIKSTNYNQITISELEVNLEPHTIVILGKWHGVFRDDYHDILEQFPLWQMFMTVEGIEIVELDNKKFFQVSSGGNFSLNYLLSRQDFKIQVNPNKVTIGFDNQIHQAFCQFFTKYNERITEPLMESGIVSEEVLQKIVEEEVKHKFFKITELSVNNSCITLKIDESYASNKELVDSYLT